MNTSLTEHSIENQYMIGMYGSLDEFKFKRDYRDSFYGIEACLFENESDMDKLKQLADQYALKIGVHFPLRAGKYSFRDAPILAEHKELRDEAYRAIQQELDYLSAYQPVHVLFHYPKPVILDSHIDWSSWKFGDSSEYEYTNQTSITRIQRLSKEWFEWIQLQGERYHFVPVMELDAWSSWFWKDYRWFLNLLDTYSNIRICLDMQRLYLQQRIDPDFDVLNTIRKLAPYTYSIHLSNMQYSANREILNRHQPVLPEQTIAAGWAPIDDYLKTIFSLNSNVKIMFEHRSELISETDLERCYAYVRETIQAAQA
ncbi:sugar phosphate isomerase/epimerase [Paenibacillus sp. WLX2291]|uniref:sugar phosphate isomerase/epimerase n=1 Tax=Paenibacillus sp. WLX2291 TaxID=3296934 RepID=UPI0039843948